MFLDATLVVSSKPVNYLESELYDILVTRIFTRTSLSIIKTLERIQQHVPLLRMRGRGAGISGGDFHLAVIFLDSSLAITGSPDWLFRSSVQEE